MVSKSKIKSFDFYRKIPRDLTESSLSGAGLSILAAFWMVLLFAMELNDYLRVTTSTSIVVDNSSDGDFLLIDFNMSFPALSCEFASVDISDVLGTVIELKFTFRAELVGSVIICRCLQNLDLKTVQVTLDENFTILTSITMLNVTKTIHKYSIDSNLNPAGSEFRSVPIAKEIKHDETVDEENDEAAVALNERNFDRISHQHDILVVNFFAPWCYWSNKLKPSWEKAAKVIRKRYDPLIDGRILLGKVNCTEEAEFCKRNHIQGYPSIRIFRKGSDIREDHGDHNHESYYGDRDVDSLIKTMEDLVAPISLNSQRASYSLPAPLAGGCRIEGFVHVKKVPGNLVISARSASHSFDTSQMNMSHVISHFSFGKKISPNLMTEMKRVLPYLGGNDNPLTGSYISNPSDSNENVTIEHYIQVVKTEVMTRSRKIVEDHEYTAHSSLVNSLQIPVAKFHVEPSPMQVLITENAKPFSHFITSVCAIVGGVFTVAGILDSILHNTVMLMRKVELGKNV